MDKISPWARGVDVEYKDIHRSVLKIRELIFSFQLVASVPNGTRFLPIACSNIAKTVENRVPGTRPTVAFLSRRNHRCVAPIGLPAMGFLVAPILGFVTNGTGLLTEARCGTFPPVEGHLGDLDAASLHSFQNLSLCSRVAIALDPGLAGRKLFALNPIDLLAVDRESMEWAAFSPTGVSGDSSAAFFLAASGFVNAVSPERPAALCASSQGGGEGNVPQAFRDVFQRELEAQRRIHPSLLPATVEEELQLLRDVYGRYERIKNVRQTLTPEIACAEGLTDHVKVREIDICYDRYVAWISKHGRKPLSRKRYTFTSEGYGKRHSAHDRFMDIEQRGFRVGCKVRMMKSYSDEVFTISGFTPEAKWIKKDGHQGVGSDTFIYDIVEEPSM